MTEEIMERFLAKVRQFHEELRAEMKSRIGGLVSWMGDHQSKTEANYEDCMDTMKASQERMKAQRDVSLETSEICIEKIEANQGTVEARMEARLEEYLRTEPGTMSFLHGVRAAVVKDRRSRRPLFCPARS
jgi:hypothetical protein